MATFSVDVRTLRKMAANDCSLWMTAGADRPYWAVRRRWQDDYFVANPEDVISQAGYDSFDGLDDDETFTIVY